MNCWRDACFTHHPFYAPREGEEEEEDERAWRERERKARGTRPAQPDGEAASETDGQIYAGCTHASSGWIVHRDTLSGSPPPSPQPCWVCWSFFFLFTTLPFSLDFSGYLHIYTTSTQPVLFHFWLLLLLLFWLCMSSVRCLVMSPLSRVYVCMLLHVHIISPPGRMHW